MQKTQNSNKYKENLLQELISYTDREIENWDNSPNINIAKNIDDVISFVSRSINGEVSGQIIVVCVYAKGNKPISLKTMYKKQA